MFQKLRSIKNIIEGSDHMKLIVGLGNPGREYDNTRHNVGFFILDSYLKERGISLTKHKMNGLYQEEWIRSERVIFLKPQSYINLSGEVISFFVSYYKISLSDLLIIHDDMDLMLGCFKLKERGSSAGHNGLKNIELHLATREYNRLKVGISKNKNMDMKDYVLGKLSNDEQKVLEQVVLSTNQVIDRFIDGESFQNLMSQFNQKNGDM